jgi:hypothetical protein
MRSTGQTDFFSFLDTLTIWCFRATTDQVDEERLRKLKELSQNARTKREELATRLYTAEAELRGKTQNVRVSNTTVSVAVDDRNC